MKNKLHHIFFLLLIASAVQAQQTPQYSLYMLNQAAQNPAYVGLENTLVANGVYRTQWVGLNGAPVTQIVNAHLPFNVINSGFGLQFENDEAGASQRTSVSLAYSYHLQINRESLLSIGISGGMLQQTLDGGKLRTPDGNYDPDANIIIHNDDLLPTGSVSETVPTFAAGVFFQGEKLEAGVGMLNLQESSVNFDGLSVNLKRNFYLSAAYNLDLSRNLVLKPSLQVKSDLVQTQAEVSAIVKLKDNLFLGTSYRGFTPDSQDAIIAIGGFRLSQNWTVAYAYDITLSPLNTVSSGSHEIMLGYNFGKPIGQGVPPPIIYNPRF